MSETVVARRYADALFQLAIEKGTAESVLNELNIVKDVFQKDENLSNILTHPKIKQTEKVELIDTVFVGMEKDVVNTLKILVQRDRVEIVLSVINDYINLYNDRNGIAIAKVYSVRALTDQEKTSIELSFKAQLNKQTITIENIIDPSLIGGLRIRVGNTIYDGSISNQLNRFKANLVSASK